VGKESLVLMGFKVEKRDGIDEQKGEISGNKLVVYIVKRVLFEKWRKPTES